MSPDTQQILFDHYPDIFRERTLDKTKTCMCWGIETGDGWFDILNNLCGQLTLLKRYTGMEVVAMQVKEKMGGLRFYWRMDTFPINATYEEQCHWYNIVEALVHKAENMAEQTCEETGEYGVLHIRGGWLKTLSLAEGVKRGFMTAKEYDKQKVGLTGPL